MVFASRGSFGGRGEQPKLTDVAVGDCLDLRDHVGPRRSAKEMRITALRLEVVLDWDTRANGRPADDLAVLRLEDREESTLFRQPCQPDRLAGGAAPAQWAGHQDVDVAGPMGGHGAFRS